MLDRKAADKLGFFLLLLFAFLVPIYKNAVIILTVLMLSTWCVKKWSAYGFAVNKYFPRGGTNFFIGLFLIIGFVSVFFSASFGVSFRAFWGKWAEYIFVFFFALDVVDSKERFDKLLTVICWSVFLVCTDAIFQYITGRDLFVRQTLENLLWMTGTFKTNNTFGLYLVFFLPVVFVQTLKAGGLFARVPWAFLAGIMIVCSFLAYSASSWIMLTISALAYVLIYKSARGARWPVFFLCAAFWAVLWVNPAFNERASKAVDARWINVSFGRLEIWKEVVKEIFHRPIFGLGINSYRTSVLGQINPHLDRMAAHSHSLYLQIAFEMGIPALLAFLAIIVSVLKRSLGLARKKVQLELAALLVGFYAYLLISLMDVHFDPRIQWIFWLLLALIQIQLGWHEKLDSE